MTHDIETYFAEGCGRCEFAATPRCKVHNWTNVLKELRRIVLDCMLTEEVKWGIPCYTHQGKNIITLAAFKEFTSIGFFKGSLLSDTEGILIKPGENSQSGKQLRFVDVQKVLELEPIIKAYIFEAIEVEKSGLKVQFKATSEYDRPDELKEKFLAMPELEKAFEALTPGRQRGYLLYFSQAKQSKTRATRIEKMIPKIFAGKGPNEY